MHTSVDIFAIINLVKPPPNTIYIYKFFATPHKNKYLLLN